MSSVSSSGPSPSGYASPLIHRDIEIVSILAAGKVVEVVNGQYDNGAQIQIWEAAGGHNQRWKLVPLSQPGTYQLLNCETAKLLCVEGAGHNNGQKLHQWTITRPAVPDQSVRIEHVDGRPTSILFLHSNKALDVAGGQTANGSHVHQWDFDPNNINQKFRILPAGTTGSKFDHTAHYRIRSLLNGKQVAVSGGNHLPGSAVALHDALGGPNEKFRLTPVGQDLYTISPVHSPHKLVVEFPNGGHQEHAVIGYSQSRAQEVFHIANVLGQPTQIVSTHNPALLWEVKNADPNESAPLALGQTGASPHQLWVIERVIPPY